MSQQKINYQKQLDALLPTLGEAPRLLLHSCCGPCSSYVLEYLSQYFRVTVLFYNPNIRPRAEYDLRLENQRKLIAALPTRYPVDILETGYDGPAWTAAVTGLEQEPEGGARCPVCYRQRLEMTARTAAAHGYPWFCTTLSVSPHKDAEKLNAIGEKLAADYGLRWLPSDFKKRNGYLRSIQLSKTYDLYRQDYCGCGLPEHPEWAEEVPHD